MQNPNLFYVLSTLYQKEYIYIDMRFGTWKVIIRFTENSNMRISEV